MSASLSPVSNGLSIDESVPDLVSSFPMDMSDLFNFDEFESGPSSLHSPTTMSPNRTPSPLNTKQDLPPSYTGLSPRDFSFFDEMVEEKPAPAPAAHNEPITVKAEPLEFGFTPSPPPPTVATAPIAPAMPAVAAPVFPSDLSGLPLDQQVALQQLYENLMQYTNQLTAANNNQFAQTTIEPSLLFGTAPAPAVQPQVVQPVAAPAPVVQQPPVAPAPSVSPMTSSEVIDDDMLVSIDAADLSMMPGPSRARQASTFSVQGDDIDNKLDRLVPLSSIFSAGRGKGGKKGGGLSSVVRAEDEDIDDDDSWRPSPEEYKKLSSKEKRQLRNKLSARAFRTRRKDYIGTLEAHIKDRDTVIDAIRLELNTSRAENHDLRAELEALKASTMKVLHPESANVISPPPPAALLNALAMTSEFTGANTTAPAPTLAPSPQLGSGSAAPSPKRTLSSSTISSTINTRKDIGAFDSRGFWGGGSSDNIFGGSTICHTLFTPEVVLPPRANLNPLLNGDHSHNHYSPLSSSSSPSSVSSASASSASSSGNSSTFTLGSVRNGTNIDHASFSEWAEQTPFSLRTMDSYRIQMWSRLAREAAADRANLAGDMRPRFLVDPTRASTSPATSSPTPSQVAAVSAVASATSNHISSKLASSFFSAFTGPSSTKLDTDKLTAVVTGRAHLAVIASDFKAATEGSASASTTTPPATDAADALAYAMAGLKVQTGATTPAESLRVRENPIAAMAGFFKTAMPARA